MKDESGGLLGALVVMVFFGWGWACKMCYFAGFVGSFQWSSVQPGPRMGRIQEETDGRQLRI